MDGHSMELKLTVRLCHDDAERLDRIAHELHEAEEALERIADTLELAFPPAPQVIFTASNLREQP